MAVIYDAATRTARLEATLTRIDAGAGASVLNIYTAGYGTLLASFTLPSPGGTVSGDVLTLDADPDITVAAAASGTAAIARITNGDGVHVVTGLTVGGSGSGANIIIAEGTTITSLQDVILQSATITHNTTG